MRRMIYPRTRILCPGAFHLGCISRELDIGTVTCVNAWLTPKPVRLVIVTPPAARRLHEYNSRMPKCLFCPTEQHHLTDEHVFPAALGGALILKNAVCDVCNHGFSEFERRISLELAPIRFLLQIPDRRGKIPTVQAVFKTATKEYEARLEGKGKLVMKPIVTEVKGETGKREFVYRFMTARQREKLEAEAREKALELVEEGPGEPETGEVHFGGEFGYIGTPDGLRTAAKIAFVGMAYKVGGTFASSDAFEPVRNYIKDGTGAACARLFLNTAYLGAVEQGPHQHSLTIAGRHDKHRVDAIVRLFGTLSYFVELSTMYDGADFFDTLVLDAHRGEVNGMLFSNIQSELLQTEDVAGNPATVWDNPEAAGAYFCAFVERAINAKMKRDRKNAEKGRA
jgi:hypothetical protein